MLHKCYSLAYIVRCACSGWHTLSIGKAINVRAALVTDRHSVSDAHRGPAQLLSSKGGVRVMAGSPAFKLRVSTGMRHASVR
jgi:hypothetical protein